MAESFYGGRRGAAFLITKTYDSVAALQADFARVDCEVEYDEYAIIESLDNDNGRIYRRTFSGPLPAGKVSGLPGSSPVLKMLSMSDINDLDSNKIIDSGAGSYTPANGLVPGKYTQGVQDYYNDFIQWKYCTITDDKGDYIAYVGFQIPYPVIEINARLAAEGESLTGNLISKDPSSDEHPFFSKWNLVLPRGISGNSFTNLRIVRASNFLTIEDYPDKEADIAAQQMIIVYDMYDYSTNPTGDLKTVYLGKYDAVSNVELTDDGSLTISFFNQNNTKTFNNKIKWITNVDLTQDKLTFLYNTGVQESFTMCYPTGIDINNNTQKITITYSDGTSSEVDFVYPTSISFDAGENEGEGTQKLYVTANNGVSTAISPALNYIMKMRITSDHHLIVLYSDPARRQQIIADGLNYPSAVEGRNDWLDLGEVGSTGSGGSSSGGVNVGQVVYIGNDDAEALESLAIGGIYFITEE